MFDEVTIAGAADGSEWSFGGSFGDFDTPSEVDLSVGMNTSGAAVLPGDHVCDDQSVVNVHLQFKFKGTFYFASIVGGSCTVTMPPIEPAGGMMEFTVTATSRTGGGSPGPEMTATIIGPRTISGTAQ